MNSAQTAFYDELGKIFLTKVALSRTHQEALRLAEHEAPGITAKWRAANSPDLTQFLSKALKVPGGGLFDSTPAEDMAARFGTFARRRMSRLASDRRLTGEQVAQKASLVKRLASGAHPAQPGEYIIPAGVSAEDVFQPVSSSPFLFRGNPVTSSDVALMSQHPDVAAGYAVSGRSTGQHASASGKLYAYAKDKVRSLGSGAADSYGPSAAGGEFGMVGVRPGNLLHDTEASAARASMKIPLPGQTRRAREASGLLGMFNKTYEDVVDVRKGLPPPVGEYSVRLSRTVDGMPAMAVRDVTGAPASSVFGQVRSGKTFLTKEALGPADVEWASRLRDESRQAYKEVMNKMKVPPTGGQRALTALSRHKVPLALGAGALGLGAHALHKRNQAKRSASNPSV